MGPDLRFTERLLFVARVCACLCTVTGCLVLLGWWLNIGWLKSILSGYACMKPNTAVCFALAGLALYWEIGISEYRTLTRFCGALVLAVGAVSLLEDLTGWSAGIDDLIFRGALHATGGPAPGRMSPASAMIFVILGLALLTIEIQTRGGHRPYQLLALLAAAAGLVALLGYLYGAKDLYRFHPYASVSVHTAALTILASLGLLGARPRSGLMATVNSRYVGGLMARRVLPMVTILTIVIGYVRLAGERAGLYSAVVGTSLFAAGCVGLFATVVWFAARELNRLDLERRQASDRMARLAAIVDYTDDAVMSGSLDGKITSWNRGAERLFGYSEAEALGKTAAELVLPPGQIDDVLSQFREQLLQGRGVSNVDAVRRRKDGSLIHVQLTTSPVRDASGQITGLAVVAHDITVRKRYENELRASEERLRERAMILDLAQVMIRDLEGRIVLWNKGAEKLYGFSREEAMGRVAHDLLRTEFPEARAEIERKLRETGAWEGELVHRKKNGSRIVVASHWTLHYQQGKPSRILEVNSDITALRQIEETLRPSIR